MSSPKLLWHEGPLHQILRHERHGRASAAARHYLPAGTRGQPVSRVRDLSLLAGRVVLGGYLAGHGAQKLFGAFGGPGLDAASIGFDRLGLRPGRLMATVAAASELGGGFLVVTGTADPIGPIVIAGTMAVASATHLPNGPFAQNHGYELPLTNMAGALVLAATGPGRYSVDRLLRLHVPPPLVGLMAAGCAAAAGASLALVLRASRRAQTPQTETASTEGEVGGEGATGVSA